MTAGLDASAGQAPDRIVWSEKTGQSVVTAAGGRHRSAGQAANRITDLVDQDNVISRF